MPITELGYSKKNIRTFIFEMTELFDTVREICAESLEKITDLIKRQIEKKAQSAITKAIEKEVNKPEILQEKKQVDVQKEPLKVKEINCKNISHFKIPFKQISQSYGKEHLKFLCCSPYRWVNGRHCNAEEYAYAAKIIDLPEEVIAYAYEINRINFPQELAEEDKVKNGSALSDLEIAKSIMGILAKYDIERGAFFKLRGTPKKLTLASTIQENIKRLQKLSIGKPRRSISLLKMMKEEKGVDRLQKNENFFVAKK